MVHAHGRQLALFSGKETMLDTWTQVAYRGAIISAHPTAPPYFGYHAQYWYFGFAFLLSVRLFGPGNVADTLASPSEDDERSLRSHRRDRARLSQLKV